MESDEVDEAEDLSPAEALASTRAARDAIASRVAVLWTWHALVAAGTGAFLWMIMHVHWLAFLGTPFWLAALWLKQQREHRAGVVSDGSTSRTRDPVQWWLVGVVLAIFCVGFLSRGRWTWTYAPEVLSLLAASVVFTGYRWINRRAIARIRNAS